MKNNTIRIYTCKFPKCVKNLCDIKIPLILFVCLFKIQIQMKEKTDSKILNNLSKLLMGTLALVIVSGLAVPAFAGVAVPEEIPFGGTIRDFCEPAIPGSCIDHPNFEDTPILLDPGIVESTLGVDGKPVYTGPAGNPTTTNETDFNQWYNDVEGVNSSGDCTLTLSKISDLPLMYQYSAPAFYPIDEESPICESGSHFGNQDRPHNYSFTFEQHSTFTYLGGETFSILANDDAFVFINGELVIDLGGLHGALPGFVNLDTLGLTPGETYTFDLFFAERHTTASTFIVTTNILLEDKPLQGDPPTLTVIKNVVNDNGGTAVPSDFTINVSNPLFDSTSFAGASGEGVTITIDAGETVVTENPSLTYAGDGGLGDCNFVAELGEEYTCTITNDDIAAGLTLQMILVLDDNGVATPGDFVLSADGPIDFSGPGPIVESGDGIVPGTYSLSATGSNYFDFGEWSCVDDLRAASSMVSIGAGDSLLCTIIIDDKLNSDSDPIPDEFDNCPNVANPEQIDTNGNGIGDMCESSTGDNEWDTRPTFGINHETRGTLMVDNGFEFNANTFTITDNHHTPFDQQKIEIGTVNSFAATVYADKALKVQEFLFGVPQVGLGHLAELRVEVWFDNDNKIEEIKVLQDTEVIDRDTLRITHQKSKCLDADTELRCDTTTMSAVFLEPLKDDVMAIKAMDFKLRDQTTYLNDGFDISGDSLNPMVTKLIASPTKGEGLIEVTQNQKYSDFWSTSDGRIFEMNSFGSFKQINPSFERFQDGGNAFTRVHSEFGKIVNYEQNRASDIFDASSLVSELPDSFSYEFTITERITEEVIQEMIIQEHLAQNVLDEMSKQARWH